MKRSSFNQQQMDQFSTFYSDFKVIPESFDYKIYINYCVQGEQKQTTFDIELKDDLLIKDLKYAVQQQIQYFPHLNKFCSNKDFKVYIANKKGQSKEDFPHLDENTAIKDFGIRKFAIQMNPMTPQHYQRLEKVKQDTPLTKQNRSIFWLFRLCSNG